MKISKNTDMNKEIELKAAVNNPDKLKTLLCDKYGGYALIDKNDIYYQYPSGQLARLRRENNRSCVTVKRKTMSGGVEVNDELEFSVDDGEGFLSFMRLTGAHEYLSKNKKGYRFAGPEAAVIELCEVSSLGWFVEIEKVVSVPEEEAGTAAGLKVIEEARRVVLGILDSLGISESSLEHRYYSEMLLGGKQDSDGTKDFRC